MNKLSNQPYKGCNDYKPEDFQKLKYIFDTWRKIATKYAYKEYLTPVLESIELYEAKSGEDIQKELFLLQDSGGRRLALRPEMTPSVTRLITQIYNGIPKPIRLFSIANFFRGERPQKGRYREFWQLNIDIFGDTSIYSDIEILQSALDLMIEFGAQKGQFILKFNHRKLIDYLLTEELDLVSEEMKTLIVRKLDKFKKLTSEEFISDLKEIGLIDKQIYAINNWMQVELIELQSRFPNIKTNQGYIEVMQIYETLNYLGYGDFISYSTDLIRGFDYYDGSIFEVFDLNPNFSRSLFGGGRYNGLAKIFGSQEIPAVGYAPGSPISFFLDNWNLWPEFKDKIINIFVPIIGPNSELKTLDLIKRLRQINNDEKNIYELGTSTFDLPKALTYANKRGFEKVIIYGENEQNREIYIEKDMRSGEQLKHSLV